MTAVVLLGHSHLLRLKTALERRELPREAVRPGLSVYVHDVWQNRPDYADSAPGGGVLFNPAILAKIDAVTDPSSDRVFVTLFGGNGHVVFGLSRHQRPFDVVLPDSPDLPLEEDAEIVPYSYLDAAMHAQASPYLWQMVALRQAVSGRILCLESPPPYADDEYVRGHLGTYVPDPGNVVSSTLRLKLWRIHSRKVARHCAAGGTEFLPVPPETLEPPGFMARAGYGPDATHGNAWFGERVVQQLEQVLGQPIVAFDTFA